MRTNFFCTNFLNTPGVRDIPAKFLGHPRFLSSKPKDDKLLRAGTNFSSTTPSRGRPPPQPAVSGPKKLIFVLFFCLVLEQPRLTPLFLLLSGGLDLADCAPPRPLKSWTLTARLFWSVNGVEAPVMQAILLEERHGRREGQRRGNMNLTLLWLETQKPSKTQKAPQKHRVYTNFFGRFARTSACFPVKWDRRPAEII